jgi:hypothetical protein
MYRNHFAISLARQVLTQTHTLSLPRTHYHYLRLSLSIPFMYAYRTADPEIGRHIRKSTLRAKYGKDKISNAVSSSFFATFSSCIYISFSSISLVVLVPSPLNTSLLRCIAPTLPRMRSWKWNTFSRSWHKINCIPVRALCWKRVGYKGGFG